MGLRSLECLYDLELARLGCGYKAVVSVIIILWIGIKACVLGVLGINSIE